MSTSEGVLGNSTRIEHPSGLGREDLDEVPQHRHNQENLFIDADLDQAKLNRKIHEYNKQLRTEDTGKKALEKSGHKDEKLEELSPGMKWHRRLSHLSIDYLRKLKQTQTALKNVKFGSDILESNICKLSKMEEKWHTESREKSENSMGRLHSDLMGPINPVSFPGSNRYIVTFTDDFSRYAKLYPVKQKSCAGDCLEDFIRKTCNMLGTNAKVCFIRAACAKENIGGKFHQVMEEKKIDGDFSPTYRPQLNGTAERLNKTLEFRIRAMLLDSGLPPSMWSLAAEAATHVYNRSPH